MSVRSKRFTLEVLVTSGPAHRGLAIKGDALLRYGDGGAHRFTVERTVHVLDRIDVPFAEALVARDLAMMACEKAPVVESEPAVKA